MVVFQPGGRKGFSCLGNEGLDLVLIWFIEQIELCPSLFKIERIYNWKLRIGVKVGNGTNYNLDDVRKQEEATDSRVGDC